MLKLHSLTAAIPSFSPALRDADVIHIFVSLFVRETDMDFLKRALLVMSSMETAERYLIGKWMRCCFAPLLAFIETKCPVLEARFIPNVRNAFVYSTYNSVEPVFPTNLSNGLASFASSISRCSSQTSL